MKLRSSIAMMALLGLLLGSLGFGSSPLQTFLAAPAATILYAQSGGSSSGDCSSWATACELRYALGVAQAGDEIWVAAGTYKPAPGTEVWLNFGLKSDVELYGGFPGNGGGWEQRDPETHVTVLSGDIDNNDITDANGVIVDAANILGNNSYHVVTGHGTTATAVLDGFTITGGNAKGPEQYNEHVGGGMFNDSGSPMLANVTFSGNRAARWGGGMYNVNSSPTLAEVTFEENEAAGECGGGMASFDGSRPDLTDVIFSGNKAHLFGGGMHNVRSHPELTRVTFSGNLADLSGGGMFNDNSSPVLTDVTFGGNMALNLGGGMANLNNSNPTLTGVTFSSNSATNHGGGMYNDGGSLTLTNVTFTGNTAGGYGGGIHNYYGTLTINRCMLASNWAAGGGGGTSNFHGTLTINSSTFYDNEAYLNGGAVDNREGTVVVNNSTFSGNRASEGAFDNYGGGGICNEMEFGSAELTINNSTIGFNSARWGGGLGNFDGTVNVKNTILAGNTVHAGGAGPQCDSLDSGAITSSYNLESGTDCEFTGPGDLQNADADLGPLQDNGGPTWTHALGADSWAIDAGSCTDIAGNPVTVDQRGVPRIGPCDIGAYEYVLRVYLPQVIRSLP